MSITNYLINDLAATHLFLLDSDGRDGGSGQSTTLTKHSAQTYAAQPVCEGVSTSLQSTNTNSQHANMPPLPTPPILTMGLIFTDHAALLSGRACQLLITPPAYLNKGVALITLPFAQA